MTARPLRAAAVARAMGSLAREAGARWVDHQCYRLGASLAYYALYALFPLLLLAVATVGFLLGTGEHDRARVLASLPGLSPAVRDLMDQTLMSMQEHTTARGWGAVIGAVTLVVAASGVFTELEFSLDVIWKAPSVPARGMWSVVRAAARAKLLSFGAVLGAAIVLVVSLAVSTGLRAVGGAAHGSLGAGLAQLAEDGISALCITLLVAAVFHRVPHVRTRWRDVLGGAFVTGLLLVILKVALSWYLVHLGSYAAYGAVGAVLVLLTWIYVASLVLFYGAEFACVYAERYGSLSPPPGS